MQSFDARHAKTHHRSTRRWQSRLAVSNNSSKSVIKTCTATCWDEGLDDGWDEDKNIKKILLGVKMTLRVLLAVPYS